MASSSRRILIWDPVVRIFHWATAALFIADYWLLEAGETPHRWAGYTIAALLAVRIVWGFVGPTNARFVCFWPTPTRLLRHWQQLQSRRFDAAEGHNPAGALMILFMLLLLAATATSGWMQGLDRFWGEDWVAQSHRFAANTLMVAVVIHIASVILMSWYTRLGLVRAMITGRRNVTIHLDQPPP